MKDSKAGVEAYMGYLESLHKSDDEYFLEGGQAVNFWAEYIDARIQRNALACDASLHFEGLRHLGQLQNMGKTKEKSSFEEEFFSR